MDRLGAEPHVLMKEVALTIGELADVQFGDRGTKR
jgi:hypothetical protein